MKSRLPTQPYRGARDFYPEEMRIQNYIYTVWSRVCLKFGFEEYDFPILEPLEIFAAKTGQEIVNDQLFSFEDKSGRKLAIRPELTPGTVRMIAEKYAQLNKPLKWFMIGNNWRYEKPQVGRGREFNQLEANIFGVDDITADFEIFSLIVDIMKEFGATKDQFELKFSDRKLISALLEDTCGLDAATAIKVRRFMDKYEKMPTTTFEKTLKDMELKQDQINHITGFMECELSTLSKVIPQIILDKNQGYRDITNLNEMLKNAGLQEYCTFSPGIIRGFDYSDGLVYEVFDKNTNNRRSLFGGERFDKLINIFIDKELPATGFAMGDWTLVEFLKNWNLLPKMDREIDYLVTVWPSEDKNMTYFGYASDIASKLRQKGKNVFLWSDRNTKLDKQLKYADRNNVKYAIIAGESEIKNGEMTIKDLQQKTQNTLKTTEFLNLVNDIK